MITLVSYWVKQETFAFMMVTALLAEFKIDKNLLMLPTIYTAIHKHAWAMTLVLLLINSFIAPLVAIAAICFLVSLSTCISFICRVHKSRSYAIEKKTSTATELANVAERGTVAAPITIIHHVPSQNQDQQANTANTNTAGYDSFESDDDEDDRVNFEPTHAGDQGIYYPGSNTEDRNQNNQGGYPEGTYYQDQNGGLELEYADELEDGDVKYDAVTESSEYVSESDYIKQEFS